MMASTFADPRMSEMPAEATEPGSRPNRRRWLRDALGVAAGGLTGALAHGGYARWLGGPRSTKPDPAGDVIRSPHDELDERSRNSFLEEAHRIRERHRLQTAEDVRALKARYERPVYGRMRVWELIEKLALCIDPTDGRMRGGSQWLHVQQVLSAMEQDGVADTDLFLIALLHDLGKVLLLTGEVPENVVCRAARLGDDEPGAGLDNVLFQFGHGEWIYSRVRGHVPETVAWSVRYHTIDLGDAEPYMNDRDREDARRLRQFCRYDQGHKSADWTPRVSLERYRDLIERQFPQPILF